MRVFLIIFLLSNVTLAQNNEYRLFVSSNNFLVGYRINFATSASFGFEYKNEKLNIGVGLNYTYLKYLPDNFNMQSNNAGFMIELSFLSQSFPVRPLFGTIISTELNSNYHDGRVLAYPDSDYFMPTNNYSGGGLISHGSHGGPPYSNEYELTLYQGTRLLGFCYSGVSIKLIKNLKMSLAAGCYLRRISLKKFSWVEKYYDSESVIKAKYQESYDKAIVYDSKIYHYVTFQMGLSYSIPLKKKTKQTE